MKTILFLRLALIGIILLNSCAKEPSETEMFPLSSNNKYQFVNRKGEIIVNPQFSSAACFVGKVAKVRTTGDDSKWGFINEDGKYVIDPVYKMATSFNEGVAMVVAENAAPIAINEKGKEMFSLPQVESVGKFHNGLAKFSILNSEGRKLFGFVDRKGKVIIEPQFYDAVFFSENKCPVADQKGNWGYIDKKGEVIINYQFDYAAPFKGDRAVVASGDFGIIDDNGKYVINPQFERVIADGKWFMVKAEDKIGWIDINGRYIINPQFQYASLFNGGKLAPARMDGKWGFINRKGTFEINPQFNYAYPFDGDIAIVKSGSKLGLIDVKGKFVANPQFSGVSQDYELWIQKHRDFSDEMIESDYFNIQAIADSLSRAFGDDKFSSISFEDSLGYIMDLFSIDEKSLGRHGDFYLVTNSKINHDAALNCYVKLDAYKSHKIPYARYGRTYYRTEHVLDKKARPSMFHYQIQLSGRGSGKANDVIEALGTILNGYESGEKDKYGYKNFQNEYFRIRIGSEYGSVVNIFINAV